jgi:hypothetical protein
MCFRISKLLGNVISWRIDGAGVEEKERQGWQRRRSKYRRTLPCKILRNKTP